MLSVDLYLHHEDQVYSTSSDWALALVSLMLLSTLPTLGYGGAPGLYMAPSATAAPESVG